MRSISDKDLEVQLSIISAYQDRQFAHQHKELYAFITSKPFDLKDPAFHAIYQDIAAFYERALAPFCSSKEVIIDASRFFHAAIHGFVSAEHAKLFTFPRSCDQSFEYLVASLITGLSNR